ncbi:MAG: AAA family ATPase [Candidatus Methylacidiphilales bacterium]
MTTLDPCLAYLEAQARNDGDGSMRTQRRPFITLSRQAGTRGTEVAKATAHWLQDRAHDGDAPWTVFDSNLIEKVLEDMHLPARLASFLPEDASVSLRNIIEESLGLHPSTYEVASKTTETMVRLAGLGFCILVGRGGNLVLQKFPQALHVRLVGDYARRVRVVAESRGLTLEQARDVVTQEDGARKRYTRTHFHRDNDDPLMYDMVLNMDRFSVNEAATVIGQRLLDVTTMALATGRDPFAAELSHGNMLAHLSPSMGTTSATSMASYPITDPYPVS